MRLSPCCKIIKLVGPASNSLLALGKQLRLPADAGGGEQPPGGRAGPAVPAPGGGGPGEAECLDRAEVRVSRTPRCPRQAATKKREWSSGSSAM